MIVGNQKNRNHESKSTISNVGHQGIAVGMITRMIGARWWFSHCSRIGYAAEFRNEKMPSELL